MLIISMLLLCIGVGAQTAKNVGKAGAVVKTVKAEERPEVLIETTMGNIRVRCITRRRCIVTTSLSSYASTTTTTRCCSTVSYPTS